MFDSEQLKTLAAKAVSSYIQNGVALTDAVAALSRSNGLNTEQTKRLVEATNQVAYLKILETAKDRTFNFPVAVYDDVLSKMVTPEGILDKQASSQVGKRSPLDIVNMSGRGGLEKAASTGGDVLGTAEDFVTGSNMSDLVPYLPSLVFSYRAELEKLAYEIPSVAESMLPLVDALSKDPLLDAKLCKVAAAHPRELYSVFGIEMEKSASIGAGYLFKEFDLKKVAQLDDLIGKYQDLNSRKDFLTAELEKVSFMAISGRLAGSVFGAKTTGVAGARSSAQLLTGDVKATASKSGKAQVVRGYQGYPGVEKVAAASSGSGLPPPGPGPARAPSFTQEIAEKWKKGLIYKAIPKGLTGMQRVDRLATGADYLYMRESIAPKHSVWDALHNQGDAQ